MALNEKIIKIRKENNLTQEEFAQRLFLTRQAVSKYERGLSYPSIDTLKLISKEFNISISELLEVNKENKSSIYKPLGYKQFWFIGLYSIYLFFVIFVIIMLNLNYQNAELVSLILSNILCFAFLLMIVYMLIKTIFPLKKVLVEYNDYSLKIKTLIKTREINYDDIDSVLIKTHGKLNSGKLIIYTNKENYEIYPLKNLNEIKTIIDQIML